jgi:ATP-dependent Clp protease protease subunit
MIRILTFALAAALASIASAETLEVDSSRLIKVLGPVDGRILEKANELMELATVSKEPIYVLVNSPGGSVAAGNVFVDAMGIAKQRGIVVKCVTSIYAASMAFTILANCSERYVLPQAELLFHPVRVAINDTLTAPQFQELATTLHVMDLALQKFLVETTGIDKEVMLTAYYGEKWWKAAELQAATNPGWLIIVTDVKGIKELFVHEEKRQVNESDVQLDGEEQAYVIYNTRNN